MDDQFDLKILGRTLEHLGVQMYKKRNTAIAELVANSWDAGAPSVYITLPSPEDYSKSFSEITILDTGNGMDENEVQNFYLVVGRNRRSEGQNISHGRKVMGRKGIGKLAGFGIAQVMEISTWKDDSQIVFSMDIENLKTEAGKSQSIKIDYIKSKVDDGFSSMSKSGTQIKLKKLKHATSLSAASLNNSIARRFSRTVMGEMKIFINQVEVNVPSLEYKYKFPEDKLLPESIELSDGNVVHYSWALVKEPIKEPELRGFTVLVRGKTAQAPNFFFNVEGKASGQHGTKYLIGMIEADYLDDGTDDESDIISTDRQEIDWERIEVEPLYKFGQRLTRDALLKNSSLSSANFERNVMDIPSIRERIDSLARPTQKQVSKMLKTLGKADPDDEKIEDLADSLLRVYEYEHFHTAIDTIEDIDEPEVLQQLLSHMKEWRVMESHAILEIIKGRLAIVDKFHSMIVNNAPETANRTRGDNMHDLLAGYPWILNPEWQVLDEEKAISNQLRKWGKEDLVEEKDSELRYDFLGLSDQGKLVIIEIKRSGHPYKLRELHKLEEYKSRLERGNDKEIFMVFISGGETELSANTLQQWNDRDDILITTWKEIYEKTKSYYAHYRAVLEGDINDPAFNRKTREVLQTRKISGGGPVLRNVDDRKSGLGTQDVNYE